MYLKLFENFNQEDVLDFCKSYLAYLFDDESFKIKILDNKSYSVSKLSSSGYWSPKQPHTHGGLNESTDSYVISIYKESSKHLNIHRFNLNNDNPHPMTFYWDDIKDYFIPFLNVLNEEYKLVNIIFTSHISTHREVKLEDIENGVLFSIKSINITIKK